MGRRRGSARGGGAAAHSKLKRGKRGSAPISLQSFSRDSASTQGSAGGGLILSQGS